MKRPALPALAAAIALFGALLIHVPEASAAAPHRRTMPLRSAPARSAPGVILIAERGDALTLGAGGHAEARASSLSAALARFRLDRGTVLWNAGETRFMRLESADPSFDAAAAARALGASGALIAAVPDLDLRLFLTLPNDPYLGDQWYVNDGGVADVRLPLAWDTERGSATVRIGVIDTGVDLGHPDLSGQIWTNPGEIPGNGVDDDGDGYVDDVHGWDFGNQDNDPNPHAVIDTLDYGLDIGFHGTMVAGIAGAATDNGQGIAGAGWHSSIVPLKVVNSAGDIPLSAVSEAFAWAAAHHLEVLNMSFGTTNQPGVPEFFQALVDQANAAGVLCVAAAGNDGTGDINYPAGCTGVLSVGSTEPDNTRSSFSNWGPTVRIGAPGTSMWSSICRNYVIDDFSQLFYEVFFLWDGFNPYMYGDGTSFAAPLAAGVCALVRSQHPGWEPAAVIRQVILAGDVLPFDEPIGPKLNAARAVGPVVLAAGPATSETRLIATPNPFARDLTARFALVSPERVRLGIYDCSGRLVRELIDGELAPGAHEVAWDGVDARGRRAPVGVYFVELTRATGRQGCRVIRLR